MVWNYSRLIIVFIKREKERVKALSGACLDRSYSKRFSNSSIGSGLSKK